MPRYDVVGVGQNSVDNLLVLPRWPEPAGALSKLRIRTSEVRCGGQTATAMAACARLGLSAKYIGPVGSDANGTLVRRELAAAGVDISDVLVCDVPNGTAVVLIDETSGERVVLWNRDERLRLADGHVRPAMLAGARLVHVDDGDTAAAVSVARTAREMGIVVTSDIDKSLPLTEELIGIVSYPIMAGHVPSALTGEDDIETALEKLGRRLQKTLVVTLGAGGAMALEGGRLIRQPAFEVRAVDTTGAGDVFRAGFIYSILRGAGMEETLRFSCAAAAASCTRIGAIAGAPDLPEVEALLAHS